MNKSQAKELQSAGGNTIVIYPNPAKQNFTVRLNGVAASEISIYTMTGKLVYHSKISDNSMEINENLNVGMYLVQIKDINSAIVNKKLIIE